MGRLIRSYEMIVMRHNLAQNGSLVMRMGENGREWESGHEIWAADAEWVGRLMPSEAAARSTLTLPWDQLCPLKKVSFR